MRKILLYLFVSAFVFGGCTKDEKLDYVNVDYEVQWPDEKFFTHGESAEYDVTHDGNFNLEVTAPAGWTVDVSNPDKVVVTAPARGVSGAQSMGMVAIKAQSTEHTKFALVHLPVKVGTVFTFEDVPASYLAGPTEYGENLYTGYANQYIAYTDAATNLTMGINEGLDWYTLEPAWDFWNGGIAISQWNDLATAGDGNQCSVFYKDPATGFGGNNGSRTFGVGMIAEGVMGPDYMTELKFESGAEKNFSHVYVSNSTYVALAMKDGYGVASPLTYEDGSWAKLIIRGHKADGTITAVKEFYLADFRTAGAGGIVTGWHKIDLLSLGRINGLSLNMESSDVGAWGMNTPAYICIDDVAYMD